LWEQSFGGAGLDNLYSLQQTKDGGYVLAGYSSSTNGGNKSSANYGRTDFWLIKLAGPLPSLSCPTGIVAECTGPGGALVSFTATATNTCQTNVSVVCLPPSGSLFSLG